MNEQSTKSKQYVYKLTLDPEHHAIDVIVNGQSTPFDSSTGL